MNQITHIKGKTGRGGRKRILIVFSEEITNTVKICFPTMGSFKNSSNMIVPSSNYGGEMVVTGI